MPACQRLILLPIVTGTCSKLERRRHAVRLRIEDARVAIASHQIAFDNRIGDVVVVADILDEGLDGDGIRVIREADEGVGDAPGRNPIICRVEFTREIGTLAAVIAAQCR